jgi:hypothetical protein
MVSAVRGDTKLRLRRDGGWGMRKVGAVDWIELVQMLLGHPEADILVSLGDLLLDVCDVRYSAERESIIMLLHSDDEREVLGRQGRREI